MFVGQEMYGISIKVTSTTTKENIFLFLHAL